MKLTQIFGILNLMEYLSVNLTIFANETVGIMGSIRFIGFSFMNLTFQEKIKNTYTIILQFIFKLFSYLF